MYPRLITNILKQWKERPSRKPLFLRGARQVGKTTAVQIFAKEFDQFLHLNLENLRERRIFSSDQNVQTILQAICFEKQQPLPSDESSTLLFIDEIQNSPEAIALLRYFYEEIPNIHVIAAGSLLEHAIDTKRISFPVGRVEFAYMHPLSFYEFLGALGENASQTALETLPFPDYAYDKVADLFYQFTMMGGMPEVARRFSESRDLVALGGIYESLLSSYVDDAKKYADSHAAMRVIEHVLTAAPLEAGKRIVFQGFGKSSYRSREVGEALRTLEKAMLIRLIYPCTNSKLPLMPDQAKHPRLQFLDTGLLNFQVGIRDRFVQKEDINSLYNGLIAEHIVGQELLAQQFTNLPRLAFWCRDSAQANAEVDFLFPFESYLIPIEVKAGATGTLRSLHQFMNEAPHPYAVRISSKRISQQKLTTPQGTPFHLLNLPHFLTGNLERHLRAFVEKY